MRTTLYHLVDQHLCQPPCTRFCATHETVQCSAVQCSIAQHRTVMYCTVCCTPIQKMGTCAAASLHACVHALRMTGAKTLTEYTEKITFAKAAAALIECRIHAFGNTPCLRSCTVDDDSACSTDTMQCLQCIDLLSVLRSATVLMEQHCFCCCTGMLDEQHLAPIPSLELLDSS